MRRYHRVMKVDGRCQVCVMEDELVHHVLFQCDVARQVRALSGIPQPEFKLQRRIEEHISLLKV